MSPRMNDWRTFLKDNIVKVLSAIDNVVSYHNIVKKRQEWGCPRGIEKVINLTVASFLRDFDHQT